ncbi:YIP1 family protein [Pseudogulbenkiania sp. MAI-1]|uniref:YIP1 family protein n=1 Tax=Pseudogulbenkiania sp. MAI-1 TaxID=990370 RepID=UPI00045E814A|nr:YIP1 family protein [Pseudogulbenkiania sp. MAI-1]
MSLLTPVRMMVSSQDGWDELARSHPSLGASFAKVVLPASLLGSAMILYAAYFHADVYAPAVPFRHWLYIALLFLLVSWLCVSLMAYVIQHAVRSTRPLAYRDCYRLAAIAPLPIWLSALTLMVPSPLFNMLAGVAGLFASAGLILHGLDALFEHDHWVRTLSVTYTVFSVGALVWAMVIGLLVLPLL